MKTKKAKNAADVTEAVHSELHRLALQTDGLEFSEFEWTVLKIAAEAVATTLILNEQIKRGPLTQEQADAYGSAIKVQNGCFRALGVQNPYQARAN
jgi:hypothetical protein